MSDKTSSVALGWFDPEATYDLAKTYVGLETFDVTTATLNAFLDNRSR